MDTATRSDPCRKAWTAGGAVSTARCAPSLPDAGDLCASPYPCSRSCKGAALGGTHPCWRSGELLVIGPGRGLGIGSTGRCEGEGLSIGPLESGILVRRGLGIDAVPATTAGSTARCEPSLFEPIGGGSSGAAPTIGIARPSGSFSHVRVAW